MRRRPVSQRPPAPARLAVAAALALAALPLGAQAPAPPPSAVEATGVATRIETEAPDTARWAVQWADRVVGFSSQAGNPVFAARQALGKPNVLPGAGINAVAWMPDMRSTLPEEWIKVGYAEPQHAQQVILAENSRPGAVLAVYLFDRNNKPYPVWFRPDSLPFRPWAPGRSRAFHIRFPRTDFKVHSVLAVLRRTDTLGLHQLDAVGIADHTEEYVPVIRQPPEDAFPGEPENLGPNVNSFFDEVFPVISPDGRTLWFDRKNHPHNIGPGINDDIWISTLDSAGRWTRAVNPGRPLNNEQHNFVCSISPDGQTLVLGNAYRPDGRLDEGLSASRRQGERWGYPLPLAVRDFYNNDRYGEYQMAANGKVLLLALERYDGLGKRDLYASFLMPDGTWSAPMHLGPDLNTAGLEMSPFLAPDMRTLYFSSNGWPGYGSNDMFVSRRLDDSWQRWSEPLNLGPRVNSAGMDAYYTVPASGEYAYFASTEKAIGRTDLFRIALPEELQPEPVVLLSGRVLDAVTGEPLGAEIGYWDRRTNEEAGLARSGTDGGYRVTLPYGRIYAFRAEAPGYFALGESLDLRAVETYRELERDIRLVPLEPGRVVELRELFFEANSDSVLPESKGELERLYRMLSDNPGVRIEIGGHTNDRCSEAFCRELSRKRAKRVAEFLYARGIDRYQVRWIGYGSKRPVADNATEEGRARNQRVEFTVLEAP
jgi:outer membrane protein OmpA-like peptidoglycan-associated protein